MNSLPTLNAGLNWIEAIAIRYKSPNSVLERVPEGRTLVERKLLKDFLYNYKIQYGGQVYFYYFIADNYGIPVEVDEFDVGRLEEVNNLLRFDFNWVVTNVSPPEERTGGCVEICTLIDNDVFYLGEEDKPFIICNNELCQMA